MRDRVSCVLYGFGRVNRAVLDLSRDRPWLDVLGIIVRPGSNLTDRPSDLVPGSDPRLMLESDAEAVFRRARPDVAIVATKARLNDVLPHVRTALAHSAAVLCTSEELAFADESDPVIADLHAFARTRRSRLVQVGVNPGFLFDQWPLAASALAWTVDHLSVRRVVDVAGFPARALPHLGLGLSAAEFDQGVASGAVAGHIGFAHSLRILAATLGVKVELQPVSMTPLFSDIDVQVDGQTIPAGKTVGVSQKAAATRDGQAFLELGLTFHARPALHGLEASDAIDIRGRNEVHVRVLGGVRPGPATAALLVNSIDIALSAAPGYHRAGTLRPGAPWLANVPPAATRAS